MDNDNEKLIYTSLEEAILKALEMGKSPEYIAFNLHRGRTFADSQKLAKRACPLLGMTYKEFMKLRGIGTKRTF